MAVRIRLRVRSRSTGREVETSALVSSGYETERPELLVPVKVAELLGIWPSPPRPYVTKDYLTAGGPVRNYVLPNEVDVCVITDRCAKTVVCDVVISLVEDEVLIVDQLAGEIGIRVLDRQGLWMV